MLEPDNRRIRQSHRRALTIKEAELGSDHRSVATTLDKLAAASRAQRKEKEAAAYEQRALAIRGKGQDSTAR
jgi:hypothetical protein